MLKGISRISRAGCVDGSALFFLKVICLSLGISIGVSLLFTMEANATEDSTYTVSSVKVYSEADDGSSVTANLITGNAFEVYDAVSDDSGTVWYLISTDFGAAGYVKADELDALIAQTLAAASAAEVAAENQEADEQAAADNAADNTETPADNAVNNTANTNIINNNTNAAAAGTQAVANNDDTQDERTAVGTLLVSSSVNLRSEPNAASEILEMIDEGTELVYFGRYENDDGEGWYEVENDGVTGYITESVVELVAEVAAQEESVVSQSVQTVEVQNTQEQAQELQTEDETDSEFEVSDESSQTVKGKSGFKVDLIVICMVVGVLVCIAAIAVLIKKILRLLRL